VTCGTLAELSTGGRSLEEVFFDAIGGAENP
jgi:hypothetical protein